MGQSQLTAEERQPQHDRLEPLIKPEDLLSLLLGHDTRRRDTRVQSVIVNLQVFNTAWWAGTQPLIKSQQCVCRMTRNYAYQHIRPLLPRLPQRSQHCFAIIQSRSSSLRAHR